MKCTAGIGLIESCSSVVTLCKVFKNEAELMDSQRVPILMATIAMVRENHRRNMAPNHIEMSENKE